MVIELGWGGSDPIIGDLAHPTLITDRKGAFRRNPSKCIVLYGGGLRQLSKNVLVA